MIHAFPIVLSDLSLPFRYLRNLVLSSFSPLSLSARVSVRYLQRFCVFGVNTPRQTSRGCKSNPLSSVRDQSRASTEIRLAIIGVDKVEQYHEHHPNASTRRRTKIPPKIRPPRDVSP